MTGGQEQYDAAIDAVLEELRQLRQFTGPPSRFWPAFVEQAAGLAESALGLILVREGDSGPWKKVCDWQADKDVPRLNADLLATVESVADSAATGRWAWQSDEISANPGPVVVMGVRLQLDEAERTGVAAFLLPAAAGATVRDLATRLRLVADIPAMYQRDRVSRRAEHDVQQFSEALDLMVLLNAENRFMAAAMTFCNEIASRYTCNRVSLGWLDDGYVRLQAISHMERFEKKMDIVQTLETAMEEAFDQEEEIVWPLPADSTAVVRDHEAFAREQGVMAMVSLPIRVADEPVGVLTCERSQAEFSEEDVRGLRVLCDQAARRLSDLKDNDRWFGARLARAARGKLAVLLGVDHTFAKALGVLLCLALAFLLFGKLPYRVEASFILRSDDVAYLPSPFEGYIDEVKIEVGERVAAGQALLTLDTRELLLEESSAIANQNRYGREAEKARAVSALADMKIARAMESQASARLALIRYYLDHSQISAPFEGIVVEGDLDELTGAPVRKGDVLFKVAKLEKMYAELEVGERDIHELALGQAAEMAFVSQPEIKFPLSVEQIYPVAQAKEEGNVFLVRCVFTEDVSTWWRPGMSGVAKVDVGWRNVLWIIAHRTVDFFRILLWW